MKTTRKLMGIVLSLIMIISMFVPMATAEVGIDGPHFELKYFDIFVNDDAKTPLREADLVGEDGNELYVEFVSAMKKPDGTYVANDQIGCEIILVYQDVDGNRSERTVDLNLVKGTTDSDNFTTYSATFKLFEDFEEAYDCVFDTRSIRFIHDNGAMDLIQQTGTYNFAFNVADTVNNYVFEMLEVGANGENVELTVQNLRNVSSLEGIINAFKGTGLDFAPNTRWEIIRENEGLGSYATEEIVFLDRFVNNEGKIIIKPYIPFTGTVELLSPGNFNLFTKNGAGVQSDILLVGDDDGRYLEYTVSAAMSSTEWVDGEPVSHSVDPDAVTNLKANIEIKFTYEDGTEETKPYVEYLTKIGKDTNEAGTKDWNMYEGSIDLFPNGDKKDAIIEFTKVDFTFVTGKDENGNDRGECSTILNPDERWIFGYIASDVRANYSVTMQDIDESIPNNIDVTANDLTNVNTLRPIIEAVKANITNGFVFPESTSWIVLDENGNEVGNYGTDEWVILNSLVYNGEITLKPSYNNEDDNNDPNPPAGSFQIIFEVEYYRDALKDGPQMEKFEVYTDGSETYQVILERLKNENIQKFNGQGLTIEGFEFMGIAPTLTDCPTGEEHYGLRAKYEDNFGMVEISLYNEMGDCRTEALGEYYVFGQNLTYQDILNDSEVKNVLAMLEKEAEIHPGFTGWRYECFAQEITKDDLGDLVATYGETAQHTLNIIATYEKTPDAKVVYYLKDENGLGIRNEIYIPANDGDSIDSIIAQIPVTEGTGWAYGPDVNTKTYGPHIFEIIAIREYSGYTPARVKLTYVKSEGVNEENFVGTTDSFAVYVDKTGLTEEQLKQEVLPLAKAGDTKFGLSTSKFTKANYKENGTSGLIIPEMNKVRGVDVNAFYDEYLIILQNPDFSETYIVLEPTDDKEWVALNDKFEGEDVIWEGGEGFDSVKGMYKTSYDGGVWTDFRGRYADGSKTVLFQYHYPDKDGNDIHGRAPIVFSEKDFNDMFGGIYEGDPGEAVPYFVETIVPTFTDIAEEFNSWNFREMNRDERGWVIEVDPEGNGGEGDGGEVEYFPSAKGEIEFYLDENTRVIENFVIDTEAGMTVEELFDLVNNAVPHAQDLTFKGWKTYLTDGIGGYLEITEDLMGEVIDFNLEGLTFQFTALYEEKTYCEHDYKAVEGTAPTLTKPGIREHYKCAGCGAMYYEEPMHGAPWFNEKRMCSDDSQLETAPLQIIVGYSYVNGEGKTEVGSALLPADGSRIFLDIFMEITGALDHYEEYTPCGWKIIIDDEEAVITEENLAEFEEFLNSRITEDMAGLELWVTTVYEEKELCDCIAHIEWVEGKEPTLSEDGYLDYFVCTECGLKFYHEENEEIPYFPILITFEDMDEIKINKLVTIVPNEDGKAEAKVEDTLIDNAINETLESGETQIVIGVLPEEETEEKVTSVTLSKEAIEQIIEANENTEEELTVVIPLDDVIVVFDMETMKAVNEGEGEKTLNIEVKKTADELNEKQKEALNGKKTHSLVTATWVDEDGEKIGNFNGGSVVAILPEFEPEEGKDIKEYVVLYISDEGKFERMPTSVTADGKLSFETNHFSDYIVVSKEDADILAPETNNDDTQGGNGGNDGGEDGKDEDKDDTDGKEDGKDDVKDEDKENEKEDDKTENDKDVPNTGDETNLAFYVAVLLISAMAFVLTSKKRRVN